MTKGNATFNNVRGKTIRYSSRHQSDASGAPLEPNHTHFIFVDNPSQGWGGEIAV